MLSVVIPTHNDVQCLELTLRSLSRQTLARDRFEVVVIKDGPLLGYEGIEQHGAGIDLRVETLPQNLGRSGARNAGVARARGDVILFLDADGYADRDLLARHAAFHAESVTPRVLLGKRYEIEWPHMAYVLAEETVPPALLADVQDLKFANLRPEAIAGCMQTPWLFSHSNNISVPRQTIEAVGGFNEEFGRRWGWEDLEVFYRVYQHLEDGAAAFHYDEQASSYHLLQHRDQHNNYEDLYESEIILRRIYQNIDWEFHSMRPPVDVSAKVRYYREVIEHHLTTGTGRLAPVWDWVSSRVPARKGVWIATGTADVPLPDGAVTFDYSAKHNPPSNFHLVGTTIPVPNNSQDVVVSVDIWRSLHWYDLCDLLREALRVAPYAYLVHNRRADVPHDAMRTAGEIDYILRALAPRFEITVDHGGDGLSGFAVRRRTR
ncbi:glycosyltransferase family 2 protein [Hamadaea tsunoensis]|uniref:glycosyltransferase family 2 protein n=1 Tax=Hamadaea tsunoensis TaxID=53368 RepID=UPI000420150F|nr:glycosyltransferase family 2 protein [Hamadaea tsunoensis]